MVSVFLVVRLNFTETWGDEYYLGLTGIEVLGENFESIPVDIEWMEVQPFHISWHWNIVRLEIARVQKKIKLSSGSHFVIYKFLQHEKSK